MVWSFIWSDWTRRPDRAAFPFWSATAETKRISRIQIFDCFCCTTSGMALSQSFSAGSHFKIVKTKKHDSTVFFQDVLGASISKHLSWEACWLGKSRHKQETLSCKVPMFYSFYKWCSTSWHHFLKLWHVIYVLFVMK